MQSIRLLLIGLTALTLGGCNSDSASSTTRLVKIDDGTKHDTEQARALNRRAADLIAKSDFASAESLLKQAITCDSEFGPAQNNLGVVYYNQSKLYPAAQQFLLAAALMPRDPEPRNGLGLIFESSNRFDDAIACYNRARALDPASPEYLANSARARIRRGDQTDEVKSLLANISANDPRTDWNQWARQVLDRMNHSTATRPTAAINHS